MHVRNLFAAWALLSLPSFVAAQSGAKVPDPDPELERKSFQVADGFEVNLFAADPLLAKPIQMNWDSRGRLWVACSEVYPQIKPGEKANDKVIVLEDTDGDGRADRTTVFADGLLIPTGIEPGDGGAYVANSTELLHLSASKPGAKADRQRVVLSGFGTEDTHHILHTFRWGPDGMLYFNQSIYIHSHIETPQGVRRLNAGGIWQFRPETLGLNVFVRGFINTWGHHFDRWGQSLITDGANGEGITHGVPGASYPTAAGATRVLHGLNPGSPKHCGLEVLSGRHLPEEWRGNVLTNDFRGHRVCRFVLKDDGSTFASREMPELIKTNHGAFRPIDIKMGPDGAIYIADWYNPIIQHGEIDFRDPRRDHSHGRIWRVTAKARPLVPKPDLVNASTRDVLEALKAPEDWTRHHAKRVLKERGAAKVLPELESWVRGLKQSDSDYEANLLEALWTYESLDVVKPEILSAALSAAKPEVRAAATRTLGHWHDRLPDGLERAAARVADEHPRVRLEAVRALANFPTPRAAEVAMAALDRPVDRVLDYALWLTARDLEPQWMPAFREGRITFGGNARHLTFALQSVGSSSAVQPLLAMLKSGKVPPERQDTVWSLVALYGEPNEMAAVLERAADAGSADASRSALLAALEQSARQRKVAPPANAERLRAFLTSDGKNCCQSAARLAGLWRVEKLRAALEGLAADNRASPLDRRAAFEGLQSLGGPASEAFFLKLSGSGTDPVTRRMATIALAGLNTAAAAARAVDLLSSAKVTEDVADVFNAFLARKGGAAVLAKALEGHKLPPDVAKLGLWAARSSVQDVQSLTAALGRSGDLAAKREPTAEEIRALTAEVLKVGDPARGEAVYRRKDTTCQTCHAIGGAGGQVGPDLASIGASAPVDYLLESILLPNKAVKEGYHAVRVTTLDGKVVTGVKLRETKSDLLLRTAEDKELLIPVKDIDEQSPSRSLMPDGLADILTRQELLDLVRFLSELGKVGPYALSKDRVVRRWQSLEPTDAAMNLIRRSRVASATGVDPAFVWTPTYTQVSGTLPLESVPSFRVWNDTAPLSVVRCVLDVTAGGKARLRLNSAAGLTVWLGQNPIDPREEMMLDVQPGAQTLTVAIDRSVRKEGLQCVLEDVPSSPARVNIVGGK